MSRDREFVSSVVRNLPPVLERTMEYWEKNQAEMQEVLEELTARPVPQFKRHATIRVGNFQSNADFRRAFGQSHGKVGEWVNSLFSVSQFIGLSEITSFDLTVVSVQQLGFCRSVSLQKVYKRALKFGLSLCPTEIGLQYFLQHMANMEDEVVFYFAMEPVLAAGLWAPGIINISRHANTGVSIDGDCHLNGNLCRPDTYLVFVLPRELQQ